MKTSQPIGIFDSGVGGLSIWKEIQKILPKESTVYLADSRNAPYGEKDKDQIIELSIRNTEHLLKKQCKIVVVACNTATTNAIALLRNNYTLPFIGIEPATKPAAINTKTGKIGILATKGTLVSELFSNTSEKYRGNVTIIETIGEGLVPIIESGDLNASKPLIEKYLMPMIQEGVDNIVLGCTHYPFLIPLIREIIPPGINIIDSGNAVAEQTKNVLKNNNMLNTYDNEGTHAFYTNSDANVISKFIAGITNKTHTIKSENW
jgi:glutamate racemase